jgi:hypothetical protein
VKLLLRRYFDAAQTWMRVRGVWLLHVAVRATAMASTMSKAAITARTTAGYAPEQQHSAALFSTQSGSRLHMRCCLHSCDPVPLGTHVYKTACKGLGSPSVQDDSRARRPEGSGNCAASKALYHRNRLW